MAGDAPGPDFDGFVRSRSVPLMRVAYAMTGDPYLAEDLVQEVMAKVYVRWTSIRTSPDAYARTVLVRAAGDRWRLRRRRGETPLLPAHDRATPDGADLHAMREDLVRAMRELPSRQRAVVALRFLGDLTEADIAATLGCTVGTVKSQLSRGLARLRTVVSQQDGVRPDGAREPRRVGRKETAP